MGWDSSWGLADGMGWDGKWGGFLLPVELLDALLLLLDANLAKHDLRRIG